MLSCLSPEQLSTFVKLLQRWRETALRKLFRFWFRKSVGCSYLDELWERRRKRAWDALALMLSIDSPKVHAAACGLAAFSAVGLVQVKWRRLAGGRHSKSANRDKVAAYAYDDEWRAVGLGHVWPVEQCVCFVMNTN